MEKGKGDGVKSKRDAIRARGGRVGGEKDFLKFFNINEGGFWGGGRVRGRGRFQRGGGRRRGGGGRSVGGKKGGRNDWRGGGRVGREGGGEGEIIRGGRRRRRGGGRIGLKEGIKMGGRIFLHSTNNWLPGPLKGTPYFFWIRREDRGFFRGVVRINKD